MTSIPASRSARAMIFAPRSWPSRPGLATTTRIFLVAVASIGAGSLRPHASENGRLGVGSEHPLERLDDLALGSVRAGAVEQRLHQVGGCGGGLAQPRERLLDLVAAPSRAHRLEPVDLLALE